MTYNRGFIRGLIIALMNSLSQYITSTIITPDYFKNMISYTTIYHLMKSEDATAYFNLKNYITNP